MSVRRELFRLIAFAVVAVGLLWLLASTLLNVVAGPTRSYLAEFTDVSGLNEGDNVRIAGVRVGRVENMELVGSRAEVTLSVRADQPVFESTRVVIRYQNLIGQRFVALVPGPGAARPLDDGARIPADRTEPAFDLSSLLNGFAPLFSVLQPADVNRLSETIVSVLQGSDPHIVPLLEETTRLTNSIADRDRIIGSVITNLNVVLEQLAGKGPQADALIDQTRRLVDGLNADTERIFGSLREVREFTGGAADLLADTRPDLRTDLRAALEASDVFEQQLGPLGDTLDGLPRFLAGLARITQYGSWVNFYACGLNFTEPGVPGSFGTRPGDPHTEVCR
ncbi:MAG: MCE family protein [Pseudonocardia sp.]|jgi:phospholipid/cholesterol/gamma-HCH transport system substrate-binding protein